MYGGVTLGSLLTAGGGSPVKITGNQLVHYGLLTAGGGSPVKVIGNQCVHLKG